jgi:predicted XRE-type DNA-binding protein
MTLEERLWAKINIGGPDECWEWQAGRYKSDYGQFKLNGKVVRAHRVVWELVNKQLIPEGQCVLHSCDNPPCCNPTHLFLGNHQENMDDMIAKGRFVHQPGEQNGRAKLTESQVVDIRQLWTTGQYTQRQLAYIYGVCQKQISNIIRHKRWRG